VESARVSGLVVGATPSQRRPASATGKARAASAAASARVSAGKARVALGGAATDVSVREASAASSAALTGRGWWATRRPRHRPATVRCRERPFVPHVQARERGSCGRRAWAREPGGGRSRVGLCVAQVVRRGPCLAIEVLAGGSERQSASWVIGVMQSKGGGHSRPGNETRPFVHQCKLSAPWAGHRQP